MVKIARLFPVLCAAGLAGCLTTRTVYRLDKSQERIVFDFNGYSEKVCKDDDFFLSDEARGCVNRGEMTAIVRPRFFDKEKKLLGTFLFGDVRVSTTISLGDCAWEEKLKTAGRATRVSPCELAYAFEKKGTWVKVVALADGEPLEDIQDIVVDITTVVDKERPEETSGAGPQGRKLREEEDNRKLLEDFCAEIFDKSQEGNDAAVWESFSKKKKVRHRRYERYRALMEARRKKKLKQSGSAPVPCKAEAALVDISSASASVSLRYATGDSGCKLIYYLVREAGSWKIDRQGSTRCGPLATPASP